jgi:hypothetical protein
MEFIAYIAANLDLRRIGGCPQGERHLTSTLMLKRRAFLQLSGLTVLSLLAPAHSKADEQATWSELLVHYRNGALNNYWEQNGRRAMLASRLYPGIYIRDGLFWGPLALEDPKFGADCYKWFADSQMESGQIRSAIALEPGVTGELESHDDEGTLLFVLASDWLSRARHKIEMERVERAYGYVETHVVNDLYVSPPGAFRYWLDTVELDTAETLAYNQGMLCLARRALLNLGSRRVNEGNVAAAQRGYRAFFDAASGYVKCGSASRFAFAQDVSALFPEWLSRYLYGEPILDDEMIVRHTNRILANAAVRGNDGTLVGIKVLSTSGGSFFSPAWFFAPGLNRPGVYHNGAHWPLYSIVMLTMCYRITGDERYAKSIGELVVNELTHLGHSLEFIALSPGAVGTIDPARADYTWNALIPLACRWCGLVA